MTRVSRIDPQPTWDELSVVILDDSGMAACNRRLLNRAGPTDVISVAYPPLPGGGGMYGEVMVNAERAAAGPRPRGWAAARELALYVAHGCDHLAGADDAAPAARRRMRRRELDWLRQAHAAGIEVDGITR